MKRYSFVFFSLTFFKRHLVIFLIAISVGLIIACGTALYIPSVSDETSNVSLNELQEGRVLYINKCGGCHVLVVPEKYNANDWSLWVDRMESKVSITPKDKEVIIKYLSKGAK